VKGKSREYREQQGKQGIIMFEDRKGYERLVVWQNAYKLRRLVYEITRKFSKIEMRRVSQMRDAARSVKQNIQEGYGNSSIKKYMVYLGISHDSASELSGDIRDSFDDGLISEDEFRELDSLTGKTIFLLKKQLQSLHKMAECGTWVSYVTGK